MYNDFKDYYETLQIAFPADEAAIKSAYRRLARESHPDLHPENTAHYTAVFQEITEAYETLSDPGKKELYDARYRQEVLLEAPVYAYHFDDTPPDTRSYKHRFTSRRKSGLNYSVIMACALLFFQLARMVSNTAPIQDPAAYRSMFQAPAPTSNELRELVRHSVAADTSGAQGDSLYFRH